MRIVYWCCNCFLCDHNASWRHISPRAVPRPSSSIAVTNSTSAFGLNSENVKDYLSSDVYETSADHSVRENQWVKTAPKCIQHKKNVGILGMDSLFMKELSIQDPCFQISRKVANT